MSAEDDVRRAVAAYDEALRADDLDAVDGWFLPSEVVSRFGVGEVAYGADAISAGRRDPATASPPPTDRVDGRHEVVEVAPGVVVATMEHRRRGDPRRRRRTQVWVLTGEGWRIAHAHLSVEP